MPNDVQFQPASDQSILVYLGQAITLPAHERVRQLLSMLQSKPVPGVRNLHPAYCSLLVDFDPLRLKHEELEAILRSYLDELEAPRPLNIRELELPTCYGEEFGPDLDEVAALRGMTPAQVVELRFLGNLRCVLSWICSRLCVSWRFAARVGNAAAGHSAPDHAAR